jgi:hypothetical protein
MAEYNNAAVDAIEDGRNAVEKFIIVIDTVKEEAQMRQMVSALRGTVDSSMAALNAITSNDGGTFGEFQAATMELMQHYKHFADALADSMVANRLHYLSLVGPAEGSQTNTAGMTPAQRREAMAQRRAQRDARREERHAAMFANERLAGRFSAKSDRLQNAAAAAQKKFASDNGITLTEFGF